MSNFLKNITITKKTILTTIAVLFLGFNGISQLKIGDNPGTIGTSSILELESTNKGMVIPRVANSAAIATPVAGMLIYDNSQSCFIMYQSGTWGACVGNTGSTSLTPMYYTSGAFTNAENDVNRADVLLLSTGAYVRTGKVYWSAHGLTIGAWYYLDNTAGNYTATKPTTNLAQKLFFVEGVNTIHVDIEEGTVATSTTDLTTPTISSFIVLADGQISINMVGSSGGGGTGVAGGSGATVVAVFNVVEGDVVTYVDGEGGFGSGTDGGGGAGSSGVFINNTLISVAGAGAGGDNTATGLGATATTTGGNGTGGNPGAGGVGGNGGTVSTNDPGSTAGAGGGILTAGGSDGAGGGGAADLTPLDGILFAAGGAPEFVVGGGGVRGLTGGGGGSSNDYPGGGGGYSGGGAGGAGGRGGGGASYVNTGYAGYVSSTITAGATGAGGGVATDGVDGVLNLVYTPR